MGAPDLLEYLRSRGLNVEVDGDELRVSPKSAITDEARAFIRSHKAALLPLLAQITSSKSREELASNDELVAFQQAEVLECASAVWGDAEAGQRKVESMLANNPAIRYALATNAEGDPDDVLLTLAIRNLGTCDLRIPKARYDPFLIMRLLDQYDGTRQ